ncbi:hypothetical protein ACLI4U_07620 [Natrialbaceae archaeon A-CW2]|nr:hypothetical protein [Natronosalvus amylolyticus]
MTADLSTRSRQHAPADVAPELFDTRSESDLETTPATTEETR